MPDPRLDQLAAIAKSAKIIATQLGFVDTAKEYGQSVYGSIGQGLSDQMSAMPSVHVAWALIVGVGVGLYGTSRWR